MAYYRQIYQTFWTDTKVDDSFTPEDKYFYLYLLTNPHTNLCGCYEVSIKQMVRETGYNDDTILRLLKRFENEHNIISYCRDTTELFLLNWSKYNWSTSPKTLKGVEKEAHKIKNESYKIAVLEMVKCIETNTPYKGYLYPLQASVSVSVLNNTENKDMSIVDKDIFYLNNNGNINDNENENEVSYHDTCHDTSTVHEEKNNLPVRHRYGEYKNVLLSDEDLSKLQSEYPSDWKKRIERLSSYIAQSGKSYKSHLATIRNWARRDAEKEREKSGRNANVFLEMLEDEQNEQN